MSETLPPCLPIASHSVKVIGFALVPTNPHILEDHTHSVKSAEGCGFVYYIKDGNRLSDKSSCASLIGRFH